MSERKGFFNGGGFGGCGCGDDEWIWIIIILAIIFCCFICGRDHHDC